STGSVNITTPEQTIQEAQGETVHLPYMFTLSPEDQGPLFIDWMQLTGPENEVVNCMCPFSSPCCQPGLIDQGPVILLLHPPILTSGLQVDLPAPGPGSTGSVNITTPEQTIQEAQGETVHLPYMFTLSPEDQGPLFIDWMQLTGPENEVVNCMVSVPCACSLSLGRCSIMVRIPTA
ncbi:hypothetical protein A6R68_09280, partial [Neotoma lepida]